MLPNLLLLTRDHIAIFILLATLGIDYGGKTLFRAERGGMVVWMMPAAPSLVCFGFVDEIGDAWFFGSSVKVSHRALSYHCLCLAVAAATRN
jgi:hypothetical protein